MTEHSHYEVRHLDRLINASVVVPGSKSIANRALVCASLAKGSSTIAGLPDGDDTAAMLEGLSQLGMRSTVDQGVISITSALDLFNPDSVTIDARLAGTTARFLTAVAALRTGTTTVTGLVPLQKRPMKDLHLALMEMGCDVQFRGEKYHLPVTVCKPRAVVQGRVQITTTATTSSQFVTALMLIAPLLVDGMQIDLVGEIISQPYIQMTRAVMESFGAQVQIVDGRKIVIAPGGYVGCEYRVEPDASSASYPLAAVAIVGGTLRIDGLLKQSLQGDVGFIDVLEKMGCQVVFDKSGVAVSRDRAVPLAGIDIDMSGMSDIVPTLGVVALFANTPTRMRGVGFIRHKESDRIGDLAVEMRALGAQVIEHQDGLEIVPRPLHGARCATHDDHRLAMALGVAGLEQQGIGISYPLVVTKSWPSFWQMLESL